MRTLSMGILAAALVAWPGIMQEAFAQGSCEPASSQGCQNMRNAEQFSRQQEQERQREQMRDTRHDGRIPAGRNGSVGGTIDPPSVNYKKTY